MQIRQTSMAGSVSLPACAASVLGLASFSVAGSLLVAKWGLEAAPFLLFVSNALVALAVLALVWFRQAKVEVVEPQELLHWDPAIQRRGMGDLITRINHVAIIVSDVGRSLAFYTEIIGFQQIQRPNFDRHGAWLTMGNLELHLIKGVPNAPTGRDLIVSHLALETEHPDKVLEKLIEYEDTCTVPKKGFLFMNRRTYGVLRGLEVGV